MPASVTLETSRVPPRSPALSRRLIALVAVTSGLMTILGGGGVLIRGDASRLISGDHVSFVVWFNVLAGFLYVAAGIGIWKRAGWSVVVSIGIFLGTADVLVALVAYALAGGAYESRTVAVMTLRTVAWLAFAIGAHRDILRDRIGGSGAAGPHPHISCERGLS